MRQLNLLSLIMAMGVAGAAVAQQGEPFPTATPESVGLTSESLQALDAAMQKYIDDDQAVGGELLVIKNRRTVLHTAHGLADRESKKEWQPGAIACIRSMTKTLTGTAIQMLLDEGRIALSDPISTYLPEFDTPTHKTITIEQLLEHRSGLPLSSLVNADYKSFKSVRDVAGLAAKAELEFEPGAEFNYSDDGTDTLAALIGVVSGMPTAQFIQQRVLDPLGMADTALVFAKDDPRRSRAVSGYAGTKGAWVRFWSPQDDPLFPYFLGSQSAYSTCEDYARLLCLWADGGTVSGKRLLSKDAIERGLTPRSDMSYPCGLTGLKTWYGQLWMVWTDTAGDSPKRIAFGHGGSDGTMAWMWPEQDLIVIYFTQSRGGLTPLSFEEEIDQHLLGHAAPKSVAMDDAAIRRVAGQYWSDDGGYYWSADPVDGKLRVAIEGKGGLDFIPGDEPNLWKAELSPQLKLRFEQQGDAPASAMIVIKPQGEVRLTRIVPADDLPSAKEVIAKVAAAHGVNKIIGAIRREGNFELAGRAGTFVNFVAPGKGRSDIVINGTAVRVVARDGRVWMRRGDAPAAELEGGAATQAWFEQAGFIFGDWSAFGEVTVLKRLDNDGQGRWLIHVAPKDGWPCAIYVDEATGRVVQQDRIVDVPGLGAIGVTTSFGDFQPVGPAVLPSTFESTYSAVLGSSRVHLDRQEVIEADASAFDIDAPN